MSEARQPRLVKWPFLLGDLILLGSAWLIYTRSPGSLGQWAMPLMVVCVAAGAACIITPFLVEYRGSLALAQTESLSSIAAQVQNMEQVAEQITQATGRWQLAQEAADKTSATAQQITQRISDEARAFTEFMQRANEGEKATLRLEVEKLRRAELDWVQVLVRVLDHVYALHQGALRSGQGTLIEQTNNFQNACREAARRVGLAPFTPEHATPFDAQRHQLLEDAKPPTDATVSETLAAGYTFQGRLVRPALVRVQGNGHQPAKA